MADIFVRNAEAFYRKDEILPCLQATASFDMGDLSMFMPVLHSISSGISGGLHSKDYRAYNIFVSRKNLDKAHKYSKNCTLIPCGVDMEVFYPIDKSEARQALGLDYNKKLLLFASSFTNKVKNPELAIEATRQLPDTELIELAGYDRRQVALPQ